MTCLAQRVGLKGQMLYGGIPVSEEIITEEQC